MNTTVASISATGLMLSFAPAVLVFAIMWRWHANPGGAVIAMVRMLVQLLAIGYVLIYIFDSDHFGIIVATLAVMLIAASAIAVRPVQVKNARTYVNALVAISIGGVPILVLVTQAILDVEPWFSPRHVVPLAGMIFAGAMNAVSLAAERYEAESSRRIDHEQARRTAFEAALIPTVNSLLAVGLVSLPGMMTGQILSGVSPLVAAKYQIVVMAMLFGATGIAAALFLTLTGRTAITPGETSRESS